MQKKGMSLNLVIKKLQILQKAGYGETQCRIALGDDDSTPISSIERGSLLDGDYEVVGEVIWLDGRR